MIFGQKLAQIRESKKMSQGDIEARTGLLRCYISRVENGHTVPALETMEKLAKALEIPLYQFFYEGNKPQALKLPVLPTSKNLSSKDRSRLEKLSGFLSRISEHDKDVLMGLASKMARTNHR